VDLVAAVVVFLILVFGTLLALVELQGKATVADLQVEAQEKL
jgi:hypothetical protein